MQVAEILVFPTERRVALVRQTACALAALNGEAANAFWRTTARELYRDLLAVGHGDAAARENVARFSDSVQVAMQDMSPAELSSITA